MEIYSALKSGVATARHQLADAREQARLAAARREKSREDAQAEAVRVLAQLNAQLEEAHDARAEREAEAHHATSDVFQDVVSVEPSGGKAAEHLGHDDRVAELWAALVRRKPLEYQSFPCLVVRQTRKQRVPDNVPVELASFAEESKDGA